MVVRCFFIGGSRLPGTTLDRALVGWVGVRSRSAPPLRKVVYRQPCAARPCRAAAVLPTMPGFRLPARGATDLSSGSRPGFRPGATEQDCFRAEVAVPASQ